MTDSYRNYIDQGQQDDYFDQDLSNAHNNVKSEEHAEHLLKNESSMPQGSDPSAQASDSTSPEVELDLANQTREDTTTID